MASAWIVTRNTDAGEKRWRVAWRSGGRESPIRYGGSFKRKSDAEKRRAWIVGELAAMRIPDLRSLGPQTPAPTVREVIDRWRASRIDVSEGTRHVHLTAANNVCSVLGSRRVDTLEPADVAKMVATLIGRGRGRETARKAVGALAMALDLEGIKPNPARDRVAVKLPREDKPEPIPPTADHVLAVYPLLSSTYRLALLIYESTGMRLSELEQLTWGDVDEHHTRWRVSRTVEKGRRGRWVTVPAEVFAAVLALCPRDDRRPDLRVLPGYTGKGFRMALGRASIAAGVPVLNPHALRHRRVSMMHARGVPWARIGEYVGQKNIAVTANTYTHVLSDETEIDYLALLGDR